MTTDQGALEKAIHGLDGARRAGWAKAYGLEEQVRQLQDRVATLEFEQDAWVRCSYLLAESAYAARHGVRVPIRGMRGFLHQENNDLYRAVRCGLRWSWRRAIELHRVEWSKHVGNGEADISAGQVLD